MEMLLLSDGTITVEGGSWHFVRGVVVVVEVEKVGTWVSDYSYGFERKGRRRMSDDDTGEGIRWVVAVAMTVAVVVMFRRCVGATV